MICSICVDSSILSMHHIIRHDKIFSTKPRSIKENKFRLFWHAYRIKSFFSCVLSILRLQYNERIVRSRDFYKLFFTIYLQSLKYCHSNIYKSALNIYIEGRFFGNSIPSLNAQNMLKMIYPITMFLFEVEYSKWLSLQ